MSSRDYIEANIAAWERLALRADLIGKEVVLANGRDSYLAKGTVRQIRVENGYFLIEYDETIVHQEARRNGVQTLKFKIDEERYPSEIGKTIFCDLDDNSRQIRISTIAVVTA